MKSTKKSDFDRWPPWVSNLRPVAAGAVAGIVTRALCQPLDVLKVRFQLQIEPLAHHSTVSTYHSIQQAVGRIVRDEGVRALWRGHVPAQVLSIFYGCIQFGVYDACSRRATALQWRWHATVRDMSCGTAAGAVASIVCAPLDVLRTRLICQDRLGGYCSMRQGFRLIWRNESGRALFRGLWPSLLMVAPLTGTNFTFFNLFNKWLTTLTGHKDDAHKSIVVLLVAGGGAGICSKTIVYPLDLAKKRLQIQGFEQHRRTYGEHFRCPTGTLAECLRLTVRHENWSGLFKGLGPTVLKSGITTALHFCIYEKVMEYI